MIYNRMLVKLCTAASALIFAQSSWAILDIEITQGIDTAVPIAIYPFDINTANVSNREVVAREKLEELTKVISSDLYRSGLFLPKMQNTQVGNLPLNQLPASDLQRQEVEYVIRGYIEANPYDRYMVKFELIGLYQLLDLKSPRAEPGEGSRLVAADLNDAVLYKNSFSSSSKYLRNLAHHISDLIYEKITGIRGVFSSKIAYVNVVWKGNGKQEYILEVADSDGYNPQNLITSSEPIMSPTWSPKGDEIAYVSFMGNRSKIRVVNLSTGNTKTVTSFKGINGAPAWSPDGTKMALVLSQENTPKVYSLDLAANKLTQLTTGPAIDTEPRWAPDGRSIIFTSNRGGGPQIYRYTFKDKTIKRLTYDGSYNARASFTPDGNKLVMIHRGENEDGFKIAVQDLTTFNMDVLTNSSMDESPSVSANGQQIIYATKEGNRGILAEVSIDGRVKLKRPAQVGDVQEPAWSPYLG